MHKCDCCGNEYDKAFELKMGESTYHFDSFECAIHKLAPICAHCACRVLGHGVEGRGAIFCCAHCARSAGVTDLRDHAA